jgi:multimeric flavodoxin WrbA/putative sterol carrier protein
MKTRIERITGVLPHVVISVYITMMNWPEGVFSPGVWSFVAFLLIVACTLPKLRREPLSPIQKGYLLYFAANVVVFWAPDSYATSVFRSFPAPLLYTSFLVIGVLPALFGAPHFTEYFARKTTPPAAWETDIFKKINRNMSIVWGGLFAASLVGALVPTLFSLPGGLPVSLAFQIALPGILMLGIGVPFNKAYPARYQRRMGIEPVTLDGADRAPSGGEQEVTAKKEEVMSNRLRVVSINGSPHASVGNTSIMTQMMASVLADEGIDLEEIFLADKHIEYCVGCAVCLEKGKCWRRDDHAGIIEKVLSADGVILASPTYFRHVTAQMKTFLDRSLAYGHKPRTTWKPGLAISVSAGMAETDTADYLARSLKVYGAFSVGMLTAIAASPGGFLGLELVEARAHDLAKDLARAIKEKRRYPATDRDLFSYLFMGDLVRREKDFMKDDYRYWQEAGYYNGFESYVGQTFSNPPYDEEMRSEWIKELVAQDKAKRAEAGRGTQAPGIGKQSPASPDKPVFSSCRELLQAMPMGFKKEAAGDMKAVYQFEITGAESFVARIVISDGTCIYVEGPGEKADVTIKSPADVWLAVSKGELNGQAAFLSGKYKVEGNLGLLMKMGSLFGQ